MKNVSNVLKLFSILSLMIISFIACDKEFSEIDSNSAVLGKNNSNFIVDTSNYQVVAFNKRLDSLQINGLASNLLGVFNDPIYGQTIASIVTQITPSSFSPDFGTNAQVDSVSLRIPYFSRAGIGENEYTIQDSLYGEDQNGNMSPIKLSIYQNNYFLLDFNYNSVGVNSFQKYFSNSYKEANEGAHKILDGTNTINFDDQKGALIYEDSNFKPSEKATNLYSFDSDGAITAQSVGPALKIPMETAFWKTIIFDGYKNDPTILSNANNFRNYFKGLFIKAEAIGGKGNMILLNIASQESKIVIYYSKDGNEAGERIQSTYTLNFSGNRLNTFINDFNSEIHVVNQDRINGAEKLYLKGGSSMAVVNLFGNEDLDQNGISDALENFIEEYRVSDTKNGGYLRENGTGDFILKKIINDAQLIVFEDDIMKDLPDTQNGNDYSSFDRIYAYDISNNLPISDYLSDRTENSLSAFNSRVISLGQRLEDKEGDFKYKIRITEHLNNILQKDSTNTRLGLVLSTNVNYINTTEILNSLDLVKDVPAASLLTPRGTVLYGSNSVEQKKLTLKIYSTESN